MAFGSVVGFAVLLGLLGKTPGRKTYLAVAAAAVLASFWQYMH